LEVTEQAGAGDTKALRDPREETIRIYEVSYTPDELNVLAI
jgi:hypothetical protein